MIDQAQRITNNPNNLPSQEICVTCKHVEWTHYDESVREQRGACQNFQSRSLVNAG